MIEIKSCELCKSMKNRQWKERLEKTFPDAKIDIKCQSYCGPGSRTPFVIIEDEIITAPTLDGLIDAIKRYMKE